MDLDEIHRVATNEYVYLEFKHSWCISLYEGNNFIYREHGSGNYEHNYYNKGEFTHTIFFNDNVYTKHVYYSDIKIKIYTSKDKEYWGYVKTIYRYGK